MEDGCSALRGKFSLKFFKAQKDRTELKNQNKARLNSMQNKLKKLGRFLELYIFYKWRKNETEQEN